MFWFVYGCKIKILQTNVIKYKNLTHFFAAYPFEPPQR